MRRISYLLVLIVAFSVPAALLKVPQEFSKIQTAIDKAESGDTVLVSAGIYYESVILKDQISLIGQSALSTVLRGNKKSPVIRAADKAQIKDLTIENGSKGILCENVIPSIHNCIIRDNKGTGIHCLVALADISNNVVLRNDWTGIFCESTRSIKSSIKHNIIVENGYCGILLAGNSEVLIQNNVLYNNKQYGIWAEATSKKSRIIYNDFYSNRAVSNYFAIVDKSNVNIDPQYPLVKGTVRNYYGIEPVVLKGKGKDGASIGMIQESEMMQFVNDPDLDGVTGENDLCKDTPEDIDNFQDEDGCPDFDNDNDGIYDNLDLCPNSAEDFDNNRDDDGCPEFDNDNDGILDEKDLCPNNKETFNNYKDDDGCPDEIIPGEVDNSRTLKGPSAISNNKDSLNQSNYNHTDNDKIDSAKTDQIK